MTTLERDIRHFILRALHRARGPLAEAQLKDAIRAGFNRVAFTDADLRDHILGCEEAQLISGTEDEVFGVMWDLTAKGKIKAQQLG